MKKIFLGILAVAALTACDPSMDDKNWDGKTVAADQLANGIVIKQYGGDKAACDYTETAGGNWIEFSTNPSKVVRVYYKKKDGSLQDLSTGKANGLFFLKPARGSEPQQTLYFETLEFDGSSVTADKTIEIQAAQALTPEQILLCSNKGEKVWKWDFDQMGTCWGNMGADASWGGDNIAGGGFKWWGVEDAADLVGQANDHAVAGDFKPGEADNDAYMVFSEDGTVKCFDKSGNVIRSGSWEVQNWDPTFEKDAWKAGTLKTSEGATLFPYEINAKNSGGQRFVTEYEIHKLTADQMLLVYPDNGSWNGWQEATYWCFKSDSDPEGMLAGDWTWDFDQLGTCWGNMGADASWGGNDIAGGGFKWWGVENAADLAGQADHVAGAPVAGEYDNDAYMKFDGEGNVLCFDKDGNQIRSGSFEILDWDPTFTNDAWKAGTLKTSEGATLFPYEINAKNSGAPRFVTDYEIHKLTGSQMPLVYPDNGTWNGWQEATYWTFKKK